MNDRPKHTSLAANSAFASTCPLTHTMKSSPLVLTLSLWAGFMFTIAPVRAAIVYQTVSKDTQLSNEFLESNQSFWNSASIALEDTTRSLLFEVPTSAFTGLVIGKVEFVLTHDTTLAGAPIGVSLYLGSAFGPTTTSNNYTGDGRKITLDSSTTAGKEWTTGGDDLKTALLTAIASGVPLDLHFVGSSSTSGTSWNAIGNGTPGYLKVTTVPEPSTLIYGLLGLIPLAWRRR